MITEEDKDTIIRCAKRYNVESVILFGSSTRDDIESNDIDIGVKGIDPGYSSNFMPSYSKGCQSLLISLIYLESRYSMTL
ncbi:MAG: hypothetical protein U9N36_03970 [Euryarchaeota archaeon]|nr:hypothetical protein [Euryarchaeota archaeon]